MSVRLRITAVAAVSVAVVLVVAAVTLLVVQQRVVLRGIDDALIQRADDLQALVEAGTLPTVLASRDGEDAVSQLVSVDGSVLASSPLAADVGPLGPAVERQVLRTTDLPVDDEPFRLLSRPLDVEGQAAVLHVASNIEQAEQARVGTAAALALGVPVAVGVLALLVHVLVGRALQPVARIQDEVERITAEDLGRRVPEPPQDDEIARLARLMNQMLDRLDAGAARQRRFVSDAAHELRSPLARIRSELDVDAAHPDTADPARTAHVVRTEAVGMQRLVDDLLFLARRDEGAMQLRTQPTDLRLLAQEVAAAAADTVATVEGEATQALVDPPKIARALRNLLDNAVRHADTAVRVSVAAAGDDWVEIAVADDGPGIPVADRERVFERFTRLDEARSRAAGGSGLGLAIAREIARAHGGDLHVDEGHEEGARLVLRLPRPAGEEPGSAA